MPDRNPELSLRCSRAMAFITAKCGGIERYKRFDLSVKSCRKSLLFLTLLLAGSQLGNAQSQDSLTADAEKSKGWDVKQSAEESQKASATDETAAPPEFDIQAASERQKLQAESEKEQKASQQNLSQAGDQERSSKVATDLEAGNDDILERAEIPTNPVLDLSPQLRDALERQFQQIRKLLETEEAFSEALGEVYLSYGTLLKQAGRLDEAREMLVNALHIVKVNNGVNSIEQRPVLRALFEMNFARKNTEELEDNLRRIIWLEKKIPGQAGDYSFDMVVSLGNHFLGLYLENPRFTENNLINLGKATRYFRLAVNRYGDRPLTELFMPYGELAYSHFLKSRIEIEVQRSRNQEPRDRGFPDFDRRINTSTSLGGSFSTSEQYLRVYLAKAEKENQDVHVVKALLNLGDLNTLFGRRVSAMRYYERAWDAAQSLPASHPLVISFDEPQLLPAFSLADKRPVTLANAEVFGLDEQSQLVPLIFDIDIDGNVKRIQKDAPDGTNGWPLSRAKRVARQMKFRPIIDNGKLVKSVGYQHDIKIKARRSNTSKDTS